MNHECGLEITYCDDCGDRLDEGIVGQCDDCLSAKEYTFAELSDAAKDNARDAFRNNNDYPYDDWWDGVYEDAGRIATILGLDIMETERTKAGRTYQTVSISFSGFCSQGDGACFTGSYSFNPKAITEMQAYCHDVELIGIAEELTVMQLARRLRGEALFTANITTSGRYSHSGTMEVEVNSEDEDGKHNEFGIELEKEVTQLMRNFADWIYNSLEAEHDHLMSDEVIDEQFEDEIFDEDGDTI